MKNKGCFLKQMNFLYNICKLLSKTVSVSSIDVKSLSSKTASVSSVDVKSLSSKTESVSSVNVKSLSSKTESVSSSDVNLDFEKELPKLNFDYRLNLDLYNIDLLINDIFTDLMNEVVNNKINKMYF